MARGGIRGGIGLVIFSALVMACGRDAPLAPVEVERKAQDIPPTRSDSGPSWTFEEKRCSESAPGLPHTFRTARLAASYSGLPGTSDGEGNVLFGVQGKFNSQVLYIHAPEGGARATVETDHFLPLGMDRGFVGAQNITMSTPHQSRVLHVDADGGEVGSPVQEGLLQQSENPLGGLIAFAEKSGELQSYDATGQLLWSTPVPQPRALGVDRSGSTLVLYDGEAEFERGTIGARWIDGSGAVGPSFPAMTNVGGTDELQLFEAADEGLFLRHLRSGDPATASWVGRFLPGDATAVPVPDFIATRPRATPKLIRGGTGYAFVPGTTYPWAEAASCILEVTDLTGSSCGSVDLSWAGRGCSTITLGRDGTVITRLSYSESECNVDTDGACSWTWNWWPGLLK